MYFFAETNGTIKVRLMCDKHYGNLVTFKEVPFSKLFGFIGDNIFDSMREYSGDTERIDMTMQELFKKHPIEYAFIYKDNKDHDQGISADVSDYQCQSGSGYGNNPSSLNRIFDKQIIIIFRFVEEPVWIKEFERIWNKRHMHIQGTMDTRKGSVDALDDVSFDFDQNRLYYTYEIKRAPECVLNPDRMLYMYDYKNPKYSIQVEEIEKINHHIFDLDDLLEQITMCSTTDILGD